MYTLKNVTKRSRVFRSKHGHWRDAFEYLLEKIFYNQVEDEPLEEEWYRGVLAHALDRADFDPSITAEDLYVRMVEQGMMQPFSYSRYMERYLHRLQMTAARAK